MADRRDDAGGDVRVVVPLAGAAREDGSGKGGAGSGVGPDGTWSPAFPGQREAFMPGHEASVSHGAFSDRHVRPLAAAIRADLLDGDDCPAWLRERKFRAGLESWSLAEARCALFEQFLDSIPFDEAMSELTEADEDEARPAMGTMRRTSRQRRRLPAVELLRAWMGTAARLRNDLGLTPKSYAAMARDVSLVRKSQEDAIERMAEAGREIHARRDAADAARRAELDEEQRAYREHWGLPG